jgi:hypothetical protein
MPTHPPTSVSSVKSKTHYKEIMGIKVEGLDEAIKGLNDLAKSIEPQEIERWMRTVENAARTMCGNEGNSISLKRIQGNSFNISGDANSRDCIIRAIQFHLHSMPIFLRGIFEKLMVDLRSGRL